MRQDKVLIDLNPAMNNGYCGIAKENRLIFKLFSQMDNLEVSGLLMAPRAKKIFSTYKKFSPNMAAIAQTNQFFHDAMSKPTFKKFDFSAYLALITFFSSARNDTSLHAVAEAFSELIWRKVFSASLSAAEKTIVTSKQFYYSDFSAQHIKVGAFLKKQLFINTSGQDFAFFSEPTTLSVSPSTIKVIRYHDTIPITDPDFGSRISSKRHLAMLNWCAKDAYFVCNSEPTQKTLLSICPELESKTFVVPCVLDNNYKRIVSDEILKKIVISKLSQQILNAEDRSRIQFEIQKMPKIDFIFSLAALEPKKNHLNLLKAWEKIQYHHPSNLKLILGANPGWLSKNIEDILRPHLQRGDVIHLTNLSQEEVSHLYSHAKAFIFPSLTEGFGLPPLEALQCECPTIVSDIPAHRWVLDDAALYCNPYDVDDIVEGISKLIFHPDKENVRQQLINKGLKRLQCYAEDTLKTQWQAVFENIKTKNKIVTS